MRQASGGVGGTELTGFESEHGGRSVRMGGRRHLKGQGGETSTAVQRAESSDQEAQGVLCSPRKDQSTPDTLS